MATGTIVTSDYQVQQQANALQSAMNSGKHLRLFQNNFTPTVSSTLGSFTEATFTGYSAVDLTSQFGSPSQITSGEYQTASGTYTFTCSGGSPQTIYGWYIDDGTHVYFSQPFSPSLNMTSGASFTLQVLLTEWAAILI